MIDNDSLQNLQKLHELNVAGVISDSEFSQAKEKILMGGHAKSWTSPNGAIPEAGTFRAYLACALTPFRRYAEFDGRSSRQEFWLFLLLCNCVIAALAVIAIADTDVLDDTGAIGTLAFGLIALGLLASVVPLLAVEVRRLHDQGKTGWLALLNLLPYIGPIAVLVLMAFPGTDGPNEYGPQPNE